MTEVKAKKKIILLVNLGSPNELSVSAIRLFLAKFLSDKRVVNLPRILWYPILYGVILPFRSKKLLKLYNKIWHKSGISPLIYYTNAQAEKLAGNYTNNVIVRSAFCYSDPEIKDLLIDMHTQYEITDLKVIPLYPQFSSTTTLPVFDQVANFYKNKYYLPNIQIVRGFHDNEKYINLITDKIKYSWDKNGKADRLILSYHSLPLNIIAHGDLYYDECKKSSELIAKKLNLTANDYMVTFQSKFGRQKWLTPATNLALMALAQKKMSVDIICPGFVSDCLETLEEINVTNRELFMLNGGLDYTYIECLNDDDYFVNVIKDIICAV